MGQTPEGTVKKASAMASAFMKAVCYSRGWIDEVTKSSQQMSARILIIKGSHEDPL